ncbi:hypothetical protein GCM10022224_065880 [Nonomuraea antimicrobica]|uniref:Uncharacterized protein n=1 Tax=Nonomuraea antimicrobica TaxID=561173 RepID=A0ABP7CIB6_9ACTN
MTSNCANGWWGRAGEPAPACPRAARLSPFVRRHINVIGTCSFAQPDLGPAGVRQLRDPDEPDWDEDVS